MNTEDDAFVLTQPQDCYSSGFFQRKDLDNNLFPVLFVYYCGRKLAEYPLKKGREISCDLCIKASFFSRKHALIQCDEDKIYSIKDLGSMNGTKRNDLILKPKMFYELRDGDRIYFGQIRCTFRYCYANAIKVVDTLHLSIDTFIEHGNESNEIISESDDNSVKSDCILNESIPIEIPDDLLPNSSNFIDCSLSNNCAKLLSVNNSTGSDVIKPNTYVDKEQKFIENSLSLTSSETNIMDVNSNVCDIYSLEIDNLNRCNIETKAHNSIVSSIHSNKTLVRDSDLGCLTDTIDFGYSRNSNVLIDESDIMSNFVSSPKCIDKSLESESSAANREASATSHANSTNPFDHPSYSVSAETLPMVDYVDHNINKSKEIDCSSRNSTISEEWGIETASRLSRTKVSVDNCSSVSLMPTGLVPGDSTEIAVCPNAAENGDNELDKSECELQSKHHVELVCTLALENNKLSSSTADQIGDSGVNADSKEIDCSSRNSTISEEWGVETASRLSRTKVSIDNCSSVSLMSNGLVPSDSTEIAVCQDAADECELQSKHHVELVCTSVLENNKLSSSTADTIQLDQVSKSGVNRDVYLPPPLQTSAKVKSQLNTRRQTINSSATEPIDKFVLSKALGTVEFRNRRRHTRRRATTCDSRLDLNDSKSELLDPTDDWAPLIRMSSSVCKKVPNRRKTGGGYAPPVIPSPLHWSNSILSEDLSQPSEMLDSANNGQQKNTLAVDDKDLAMLESGRCEDHKVEAVEFINCSGFDHSQNPICVLSRYSDIKQQQQQQQYSPANSSFPKSNLTDIDETGGSDMRHHDDDQFCLPHSPRSINVGDFEKKSSNRIVNKRRQTVAENRSPTSRLRRSTRLRHDAKKEEKLVNHFELTISKCDDCVISDSTHDDDDDDDNFVPKKKSKISVKKSNKNGTKQMKNDAKRMDCIQTTTRSRLSVSTRNKCSMALLFTGLNSSNYEGVLKKIGAVETNNPMTADYVVTDEIKRTLKILYSRARGIPIVSTDWLKACMNSFDNVNLEPLAYQLVYSHSTSTRKSVSKRQSSNGSIGVECDNFLTTWSVLSTPAVLPSSSDMQQLTELAGGHWMTKRDLTLAVKKKPCNTILVTTADEFSIAKSQSLTKCRRRRSVSVSNCASSLDASMLSALTSLVCVTPDWFLQVVMNRKPPKWPIDDKDRYVTVYSQVANCPMDGFTFCARWELVDSFNLGAIGDIFSETCVLELIGSEFVPCSSFHCFHNILNNHSVI